MFDTIRLYWKLVGVCIRSQMQYRASFLMLASAHFVATFVDIFGIWVLFDRFKMVKGWTLPEVAIIYGIMHMGFAAAEAFARGFDTFSQIIRTGEFDRYLLRPMGTLLQVAVRDVQILRVGRFLQGFIVLAWGITTLELSLLSLHIPIIVLSIIGAACIFYGLFVIQATISFWTIESLEIMNITTYGGLAVGQYPISIFKKYFRLAFTFIIPLACVGYYPVASMLHHEAYPLWMGLVFPLAGVLFLVVSCRLWDFGVRHYHSAGS